MLIILVRQLDISQQGSRSIEKVRGDHIPCFEVIDSASSFCELKLKETMYRRNIH